MKKQLLGLSVLVTFLSASALAAGPVANIQVTGDIKPPTCTVNGGNDDLLYALGNYSPSLISNTSVYQFPSVSNQLTVSCDAETYLTFKGEDAYPSVDTIISSTENINAKYATFNLVNADNTEQQVGGIVFKWSNVMVDGQPAFLSRANDGPNAGTWNQDTVLQKNVTIGWTSKQQKNVAVDELALVSGKVFTADIYNRNDSNRSYILSNETLATIGIDISERVDFIGQSILTFSFGV